MIESPLKPAIERIQRMRDEAQAEYDTYLASITDDDGDVDDDSEYREELGERYGALGAFESVLNVLTILAHGGTPAQGGSHDA